MVILFLFNKIVFRDNQMSNHVPSDQMNSLSANCGILVESKKTEFPKKGISADRISLSIQES